MSTPAQILANQANAQKSSGPTVAQQPVVMAAARRAAQPEQEVVLSRWSAPLRVAT